VTLTFGDLDLRQTDGRTRPVTWPVRMAGLIVITHYSHVIAKQRLQLISTEFSCF